MEEIRWMPTSINTRAPPTTNTPRSLTQTHFDLYYFNYYKRSSPKHWSVYYNESATTQTSMVYPCCLYDIVAPRVLSKFDPRPDMTLDVARNQNNWNQSGSLQNGGSVGVRYDADLWIAWTGLTASVRKPAFLIRNPFILFAFIPQSYQTRPYYVLQNRLKLGANYLNIVQTTWTG